MKRIALIVGIVAMAGMTGYSQGKIDFRNGSSQLPDSGDANVYFANGGNGVDGILGGQYVASAYLASDADNPAASSVLVDNPDPFRDIASRAGQWAGGTRTFTSAVNPGDTVSLIVRVWDSTLGTYADAVSNGGANSYGQSDPFSYTVPSSPTADPSTFFMTGFEGFALNVPEPSILALAGLGFAGILLRFRRK